jgi:hypothetical protein
VHGRRLAGAVRYGILSRISCISVSVFKLVNIRNGVSVSPVDEQAHTL